MRELQMVRLRMKQKEKKLACHTDNVLDRKPHFTHAVQQISLVEEGRSCLVSRQIDISITVAFVVKTGCFREKHV